MTKREYVINEGKKILDKSFKGGSQFYQYGIEELCKSTIFNCMNMHRSIRIDGVDDNILYSIINNLKRIFRCLFRKDIEKIDTTTLIRIINHTSDIINTISSSMCITSTDKVTKFISYTMWMSMVLYSTKYDKNVTKTLHKCRLYLHDNISKIVIVVNDATVIPTIYSYITKYIMEDITELSFAIQEDDPIIKLYNSPDIVWYDYTENDIDVVDDNWLDDELTDMNISKTELIEAIKIKNDGLFSDIEGASEDIKNFDMSKFHPFYSDYACIINSIKSPKLDTQITFNLLKNRKVNNMSDNIITIHDILKKIKEKTEYITGRPLPNSILTTSDKSTDTTSESIARFNSVMELVGSLNNNEYDDDEHKGYILNMIYHTILLMLEHYKSIMNFKTVSRLYNTLCEIYDMIDKITTCSEVSALLDYVLWITYTAYCLSKDNPDESRKIRFDVDYNTEILTIKVSDIDNIAYIQNIIGRLDEYFMDIHYYMIDDKTYFDKLCVLNMNDFKPKKTIFCIVGESGSGKDTLVEYTLKEFKLQLKPVVSYTDREKRESERYGIEHHFVSPDTMTELLENREIAAYTKIGDVRYCTLLSDLEEADIYIINPNGLNELKNKYCDRFNFVTVYIDCPYTERRNRSENRSDFNSSFEKRALVESEQFSEFRESHGYDHVIDNGTISTVYKSAMALFDIFRYYRKDIR